MPPQEDRGNMHKKFGEDRTCSSRDMRADRQTDIVITILHSSIGVRAKIRQRCSGALTAVHAAHVTRRRQNLESADEDRLYTQARKVVVQRSKNVAVSGERSTVMAFLTRADHTTLYVCLLWHYGVDTQQQTACRAALCECRGEKWKDRPALTQSSHEKINIAAFPPNLRMFFFFIFSF